MCYRYTIGHSLCSGGRTRARPMVALLAKNLRSLMAADLQSALVAAGALLNVGGTSWSRTTFSGFSVLRIHQVCQSSNIVTRERFELPTPTFVASCSDPTELTSQVSGSRRIRTSGTSRFNTLAVCRFRPLSHTSVSFTGAKVQWLNEAFFRRRKNFCCRMIFSGVSSLKQITYYPSSG